MQAQPVFFSFQPDDGTRSFTRSLTLGEDGSYTLTDIPIKRYTVWVKGVKWLAKTMTVLGGVTDTDLFLPAGDANNDNFVDAIDLAEVIAIFNSEEGDGQYNPGADFNTDGFVDALDLGLLIENFNTEGEP